MTFRYQPDHKTTVEAAREHLGRQTKADLVIWLTDTKAANNFAYLGPASQFGKLTKTDLVDLAANAAGKLIEAAQAEETARIDARNAVLAAEAADGHKARMLVAMAEALGELTADVSAALDTAKKKIAEDLINRLTWEADAMYYAHAKLDKLTGLRNYFAKQAADGDKTLADIDDVLNRNAEQEINQIVNASFNNSTNPWSTAREVAEHKGKAAAAKVARSVAKLWAGRKTEDFRYIKYEW